jgi:hypothetical protein
MLQNDMRLPLLPILVVAVVSGFGCDSDSPLAPEVSVEPIHIDSVEVTLSNSQPVQGLAHVTGIIGDGCSELIPPKIALDGTRITITIERSRPVDAVCTQIAKLYDDRLPLGPLSPGDYVLRVNDVVQRFRVD